MLGGFSGSFEAGDIAFLLTPLAIDETPTEEKERAIQSGARHYSEMIGREDPPSDEYRAIYADALARHAPRAAREIAGLAKGLAEAVPGPITLLSLVRAGAPLGVLLKRALEALGRDVEHAGVSIIRDRGIDALALDHVASRRPSEGAVFVDGWTGKGAIAGELSRTLADRPDYAPRLVTLADPCGCAWLSASGEDWLIPSGILGATVSGLVSRTILNEAVGPGDFHGCRVWDHLAPYDVTRAHVETLWALVAPALADAAPIRPEDPGRAARRAASREVVEAIAVRFGVDNRNRIKPGIAEATRAVLRRVPERIFVASAADPDCAALVHLARERGVPLEEAGARIAPYRALTLIRRVS
ncbi:cysteine protease StiP family protein [Salinarimonas ramus]|uniref:ATP-binding protein n=1 Tax=Salinarimonas ramus TaxID=690164 RepID=A0A917Q4C0_9HYPH|nr:cysteine protease StiP family protein [Salinarimonas ramus]GGK19900.1 ATP-binding protein [Salinarimonas ramus]